MPPIPIVFIHKGNSWYLPYTLYQAHATNPQSIIYLIGDEYTKNYPKWVNHVDYALYEDSCKLLRTIYRHKSTLGKEFELLCIERWFVLYGFLTEHKIHNCIYLDSDILVYSDLSDAQTITQGYAATWSGFSAHSNYINDLSALKDYCDNVIDSYSDTLPKEIKSKTIFYPRINNTSTQDAISDMTFWADFNIRYPGKLLNISNQNPRGTFDISMEETRLCEDDGLGFKKIYWKNKIPQCKFKKNNHIVPMVTLHFAGKAKSILKKHFKYWSVRFLFFKLANDLRILLKKIKRRLK